jgi:hypothetical protein
LGVNIQGLTGTFRVQAYRGAGFPPLGKGVQEKDQHQCVGLRSSAGDGSAVLHGGSGLLGTPGTHSFMLYLCSAVAAPAGFISMFQSSLTILQECNEKTFEWSGIVSNHAFRHVYIHTVHFFKRDFKIQTNSPA